MRMPVTVCARLREASTWLDPFRRVALISLLASLVIFIGTFFGGFVSSADVLMVRTASMLVALLLIFLLVLRIALPILLTLILVIVGLPCLLLSATIVSLAYGVEVFAMCFRLDVGVEASPHGDAKIYQIERVSFTSYTLDHSAVLSDDKARDETVSYLKALADSL